MYIFYHMGIRSERVKSELKMSWLKNDLKF